MQSELKPILCMAAVAYAPKQPMTIEQVWVAPPKVGQVRVKIISNALCHTDVYRLDGHDPEGGFPCILGHEATAVVESVGKGVTRFNPGDVVIPCYTPQCMEKDCIYCQHEKSNLCPRIRNTQGSGFMPDGTSRFTNRKGQIIYHFMGCSTFSQFTVLAEISVAKINENADLNKVCMIGCGISTGWGAVMNNVDVQAGKNVAVWGLGAVGLSVIQAARIRGAKNIFAIDTNSKKFKMAQKFGATHCYEPTQQKNGKAWLLEQQKWGIHYTFDCTGNTSVMREALEASHRGFGESCIIGVAESGKQISTRSFQLVTGRKWLGTAFGGWKSIEDVPKLVNKVTLGEWPIDQYVTHEFSGIDKVNQAVDVLHEGKCLRAVVKIALPPQVDKLQIRVINSVPHFRGVLKTVSYWSLACNCFMAFNIFLPDVEISRQRGKGYSGIYFLSGLGCNHTDASDKSGFGEHAAKHRLAFIFPETSPRNTNIPNIAEDWQMGESASYYVDATSQKFKKHYRMWTYITKELPEIVSKYFPVRKDNVSVTGFSMGGHGALVAALKTGNYRSVSAFAPISNPTQSPDWGQKAFKLFFENSDVEGKEYDATQILRTGIYHKIPMLVEVGTADQFADKIKFDNLAKQINKHEDLDCQIHYRPYYDHSFQYVASFLKEHIQFHAKYLEWYA